MKKQRVMKPKLQRQIVAKSPGNAVLRSVISKRNSSRFFTYLYALIYGGNIRQDSWRNGIPDEHFFPLIKPEFEQLNYRFDPDIKRVKNGQHTYTEVKITDTNSSQIHSNLKQEANNLCEILIRDEFEERPLSVMEYALFKYGPRSISGLQKLNNLELIKRLAKSQKKLVIAPLNLFLFLTYLSKTSIRNQSTSKYSEDFQYYHVIRGGLLTRLMQNTDPVTELSERKIPEVFRYLRLEDIRVEHSKTPKIDGFYRTPFTVESFPVTRYFVPEKKYSGLIRSLKENHEELTKMLGIRDLYGEVKEIPF